MQFKVVTYVDPENDGRVFGTTYFKTYEEAEDFVYHFEDLTLLCVAFVEEEEKHGI